MELELAHASPPGPWPPCPSSAATDAPTPVARGDHQAEVGDVGARGVWIAGERQAADDPVAVDGDEHRRVGMAAHGLQVAALVRDRRQVSVVSSQSPGSPPDGGRQRDELRRVGRLRGPDRDHRTTTPCPPRRGSPAAPRIAVRTPLDGGDAAEEQVSSRPNAGLRTPRPRARLRRRRTSRPRRESSSPSTCKRGREIASATGSRWPTTASTTWRIAPARRTDPALPATSRGSPSFRGRPSASSCSAAGRRPRAPRRR